MGPLPGTNRDPSQAQTGRCLFTSTVKSPFCPVCPWDGWGFVPGTIAPEGPSEKMFMCSLFIGFFAPQKTQSRSKFSILIEIFNFNLDVSNSPQKIGPRWVARSKMSFSLEIFKLARNLDSFDLWALWEFY